MMLYLTKAFLRVAIWYYMLVLLHKTQSKSAHELDLDLWHFTVVSKCAHDLEKKYMYPEKRTLSSYWDLARRGTSAFRDVQEKGVQAGVKERPAASTLESLACFFLCTNYNIPNKRLSWKRKAAWTDSILLREQGTRNSEQRRRAADADQISWSIEAEAVAGSSYLSSWKKKKRQQQDTFSASPRFRIKTQSSSIIPVGSRKVITSSREKEKEENIQPGRE